MKSNPFKSPVSTLWSLVLLTLVLIPALAEASALVMKNDRKREVTFITQLNYRGRALTAKLARDASIEISALWNESKGTVRYQGAEYRARFVISYGVEGGWFHPWDSGSCADNYVNIENPVNSYDRSFYQLFGRTGTFYTSDDLGRSTTTAHEFGHGLGLEHDDYDQTTAAVPGIMFARGTFVKPQYQWNPTAIPGAPGGSINPKFRKVRAVDLKKLKLDALQFVNGYACLGEGVPTVVPLMNVIPEGVKPLQYPLFHESVSNPSVESERQSEAHDH